METPGGCCDAVVLAGGAARRLGGADKPSLLVGGVPLLDRVLTACAAARTTVVVGPERPTVRPVRWTRERPPGGGPAAAVAAALPLVSAPVVWLLAADLPFVDAGTLRAVAAVAAAGEGDVEAAVVCDAEGRDQPLLGAYRVAALRAAVAAVETEAEAEGRGLSGVPLRRLVGGLRTVRVADASGASADCDTWEAVSAARRRAGAA